MLENIDLSVKVAKKDYQAQLPPLQVRLHQLQRACWEDRIATVIVFEGWGGSGKGRLINKLVERLEPRGFKVHSTLGARTFELRMPWMRRFWLNMPNWGEMAIFDRSWYGRVLSERVDKTTSKSKYRQAYGHITRFERALADDRYIIVKFFLHITKQVQKKRFKKLESSPHTSWQVRSQDWDHHRKYQAFLVATEEMLARTETEWAPWTILEATDQRWARIKTFQTLIERLEKGLEERGLELPPPFEKKLSGSD